MATVRLMRDLSGAAAPVVVAAGPSSTTAPGGGGLWGILRNWPEWAFAALSIGAIALAWLLGWLVNRQHNPAAIVLTSGVTIYAVFYVAAQAIERLLEPFTNILLPKKDETKKVETKAIQAVNANAMFVAAVAFAKEAAVTKAWREATQTKASEAASAQDELDKKVYVRAVVFWVIATTLGILASGYFGLYFVHTIVTANPPSRGIDILVTGLVIGAGTKPLHDLISNLSKDKTDTVPEVTPST